MSVINDVRSKTPILTSCSRGSKSRFRFRDLIDLNSPTTSYRSPLAIIGHIDMNAFFAQVEQIRLGLSSEDPVVCVQWSSLIAVSYAARKYGINRMCSVESAKEKCPNVVLAHAAVFKKGESNWTYTDGLPNVGEYKVSLDPYRRESRKILKIFGQNCDLIQKASVDESYLDMGRLVYKRALELFPQLNDSEGKDFEDPLPPIPAVLPAEVQWRGRIYLDVTEDEKQKIENENEEDLQQIIESEKEKDQEIQIQKDTLQQNQNTNNSISTVSPTLRDWDDIFMLLGSEFLFDIRKQVYDILGYTTSGGLGRNMSLAKLAGGFLKPDNQTIIRNGSIDNFLVNFEVDDFNGFGGKTGELIVQKFNLPEKQSIAELKEYSLEEIKKKLGDDKLSEKLYKVLRGEYSSELTVRSDIKSMTSNKEFPRKRPITETQDAYDWLKVYAADLHGRLVELDEENFEGGKGKFALRRPRTVAVHFRTVGMAKHSKQTTITTIKDLEKLRDTMYEIGCKLARELSDMLGGSAKKFTPCSNMSLTISNFVKVNESNLIDTYMKETKKVDEGLKGDHFKALFDEAKEFEGQNVSERRKRSDSPIGKSVNAEEQQSYIEYLFKRERERRNTKRRPKDEDLQDEDPELISSGYCRLCQMPIDNDNEHRDYHMALDLSNDWNHEDNSVGDGSVDRTQKSVKKTPKKQKLGKGQSVLPF